MENGYSKIKRSPRGFMGRVELTLRVVAPDFKFRNPCIPAYLLGGYAWLPGGGLDTGLDFENPLQSGLS